MATFTQLVLVVGVCCFIQSTSALRWVTNVTRHYEGKAHGPVCQGDTCFCSTGLSGDECDEHLGDVCSSCDEGEACDETGACEPCDPGCVPGQGVCTTTTEGSVGCECLDGYTGEGCAEVADPVSRRAVRYRDARAAVETTYSDWKGFCTDCGGCGKQKRIRYIDGVRDGKEKRQCPPVRCHISLLKKKQRRSLSEKGKKRIRHRHKCCWNWAKPRRPKRFDRKNKFSGIRCSNLNGYTEG